MTQQVEKTDQPLTTSAVADQLLGAAGATGTRTATLSGTTTADLTAVLIALRPAQTTYSYDVRGNRTGVIPPAGGATTLTYDQANQLTAYGTSATYTYNGDGLRTAKNVSGSVTPFTWDVEGGLPLMLTEGTTSYVYGPGGLPLSQITATGAVSYYHQDNLGSTRALTNPSGVMVASYTYDAYGTLTGSTGSLANPFRYAGQYTDAETGFVYLRHRYYDPATANFLTRDPIEAITREPYEYAGGDPLNNTDPTGLCHSVSSCPKGVQAFSRVVGYGDFIRFGYYYSWKTDPGSGKKAEEALRSALLGSSAGLEVSNIDSLTQMLRSTSNVTRILKAGTRLLAKASVVLGAVGSAVDLLCSVIRYPGPHDE